MHHGVRYSDGTAEIGVWAPDARAVGVVLDGADRLVPLTPTGRGYHVGEFAATGGQRYRISVDGASLPDPASRHQPDGVHGASAVVDASQWSWNDRSWPGLTIDGLVIYECHIGTMTPEGTFDAAIGELDRLAELGVTAIEIMPVAQFPGARNWGYDGVFPWSVQNTYGGPDGLARFVDAAHARRLGVLLDVVYNHIGPEGNVLPRFGPYFTDRYSTPWGAALNFEAPGSDEVRAYFIESAVAFVRDHHIDGFRLDAVHEIADRTARPFLAQWVDEVRAAASAEGRTVVLTAESAANDPRLVRQLDRSGFGFDAVWNDDMHHALRVALTGEQQEYYRAYSGVADLATSFANRFVYTGQRHPTLGRRHGTSATDVDPQRFIVFSTNHDHVGNRPAGDRLDVVVDHERRKLAAAVTVLSSFTPLLFMGEEYGETAPFPYFVDHGDPDLLEAVKEGRAEEFAGWDWQSGEALDPTDPSTFDKAKIDPEQRHHGRGADLDRLYRRLLAIRRETASIAADGSTAVTHAGDAITIDRSSGGGRSLLILWFGERDTSFDVPAGEWTVALDTSAVDFGGPGSRFVTAIPADSERRSITTTVRATSAVLLIESSGVEFESGHR